jgi:tetratricopeptide (TPR) repeat protein
MATSEHADIRDPKAAIEHAFIAIELTPHTWYIDTLAEAYYAAGRYDTAIAVIKEAIAKKPDDIKYYEDQLKKFQEATAVATPEEGK